MIEEQIEYMKKKLEEYRKMKVVASNLTHDLIDKDEIVVKVQHMFPNCGKYKKCCDETWTKNMERTIKMPITTDYTMLTEKDRIKPPEGFENSSIETKKVNKQK